MHNIGFGLAPDSASTGIVLNHSCANAVPSMNFRRGQIPHLLVELLVTAGFTSKAFIRAPLVGAGFLNGGERFSEGVIGIKHMYGYRCWN